MSGIEELVLRRPQAFWAAEMRRRAVRTQADVQLRAEVCVEAARLAQMMDCDANMPFSECAESKTCSGPKHHYDECVERVTGQIENDGKAKEDCVEECKLSIATAAFGFD